ncbi:MAG: hypothetical protein COA78_04940 [Blastopirellula sp.]|nr:MAG: hypothetical protein COA78_04940 [Blastopirellula sp.]
MFAKTNVQHVQEFLKWMIIFAIAGATTVWAINTVSGADPEDRPRKLSQQIDRNAQPLINDLSAVLTSDLATSPPTKSLLASVHLWDTLNSHEAFELDKALAHWQQAELSQDAEIWRYLAMADIHMRQLNLASMVWSLEQAEKIDDDNSLVHYYFGQLHILQAQRSENWPDDLRIDNRIRLVSTDPTFTMPLTRNMYHLMAAQRLEMAIQGEDRLDLSQTLVDWQSELQRVMAPNVGDFLAVTRNQNFIGKTHFQLGGLMMDRLSLERAEIHLDAAKARELTVGENYMKLGGMYEEQGDYLNAARVHAKAMSSGAGMITPLGKIIENVRQSFQPDSP